MRTFAIVSSRTVPHNAILLVPELRRGHAAVVLPLLWPSFDAPARKIIVLFAFAGIAAPAFMVLAGKYTITYTWMTFVPLTVLACMVIDKSRALWPRRTYALYALCLLASVIGLPARSAVTLQQWQGRDYAGVSAFISSLATRDDMAYADYQAYYPLKQQTKQVYLPTYLQVMTPRERACVTLAVIAGTRESPQFLAKEFGGTWHSVGAPYHAATTPNLIFRSTADPYQLQAFRRSGEASPLHACAG